MNAPQEIYDELIESYSPFHAHYELGAKAYLRAILKVLVWIAITKDKREGVRKEFREYMGLAKVE